MVPVTMSADVWFLQLFMYSSRRKTKMAFVNIMTPRSFEMMIFFSCFLLFNDELRKETLTLHRDYRTDRLIGPFCRAH